MASKEWILHTYKKPDNFHQLGGAGVAILNLVPIINKRQVVIEVEEQSKEIMRMH